MATSFGDKFGCPMVFLVFGILLVYLGGGNKGKIDAIQSKLVDANFIEGDEIESLDDCSDTGIVTCEQVQVEKFRNGTNETDDKGMNFDVWLYAVSNPDDVLTGKHPRMMTIGPFELRKQRSDREISSFMDGEVSYRVGTTYKFRGEEPTEILSEEIVVPNIMYTALIANPLYEEIFLSIVSGMAFKMQGMGIQALNATLRKMGSFTNAEVQFAWDGLMTKGVADQMAIGGAVMRIRKTWEAPKQKALFAFLGGTAKATLTHAYGHMYGTGAALPLFVKMTCREALNFKVPSPDPAGIFPDIGFQIARESNPNDKKGDTIKQMGSNFEEKGRPSANYVLQDNGVAHRCEFDTDCMKQEMYKQATKDGIRPVDQCVPGNPALPTGDPAVDHCKPMMVRGFDGNRFPTELFGHELGTSNFSEGKLATLWVSSFGQATLRNTGMPHKKTWDGVEFHRWVVDEVDDRRENCEGNPDFGSKGLDCDSPLGTWTAAPWFLSPQPPFYNSFVGFQIPEESLYVSDGIDEKVKCGNVPCKRGSVILTQFNQTALYKKGPYDARDRAVFLMKVPVDPKIYLDTEPNTGTVIRGSKPVQRNIRIKPSILFPSVEDLLVPAFVIHESAGATEKQRTVLKSLQSATRMERPNGMVMMMLIMGWLLLSTGLLMCVWRAPQHVLEAREEKGPQQQQVRPLDADANAGS